MCYLIQNVRVSRVWSCLRWKSSYIECNHVVFFCVLVLVSLILASREKKDTVCVGGYFALGFLSEYGYDLVTIGTFVGMNSRVH